MVFVTVKVVGQTWQIRLTFLVGSSPNIAMLAMQIDFSIGQQ